MLSLAQSLSAGITTTQNWRTIVRVPRIADAEMGAMRDSGIRGRFAYGNPALHPNDKRSICPILARASATGSQGRC